MPQSEFSGTYGLLTLNGLPKSTLNAFRFLNRLRGGRRELRHEDMAPGCGLVATSEGESLQVLLWHRDLSAYGVGEQQPWAGVLKMPWAESAKPVLLQERITAGAGSCYETWQALGTPQNLSPGERHLLEVHAAPEAQLFQPEAQNGQVAHDFLLATRGGALFGVAAARGGRPSQRTAAAGTGRLVCGTARKIKMRALSISGRDLADQTIRSYKTPGPFAVLLEVR